MSRSILPGAVAIAAAALVTHTPAMAQSDAAITVSAPTLRAGDQPKNSANPRMQFVANVRVATHDLDLRTEYGRDLLDQRVRLAADVACDRIDAIEPPTGVGASLNPDIGDCRHLAVKRAQPQVRTAIRLAYG